MDVFSERKVSSCLFSPASEVVQAGGHNHAALHSIPNSVCKGMTVKYRNRGKKSGGKTTYRHVPHREKPPHLVARRNARERRRVEAVNEAFQRLRKRVTGEVKQKRLSKVRTLRVAIDYINKLQRMIMEHDQKVSDRQCRGTLRRERRRQSEEGDSVSNNLPESGAVLFDICNEEHNNTGYQTTNTREDDPYFPEYGSLGMKEISVLPDL
ncbi:achaete-scute complex protein T8-like [Saccostrea cucullata]|uniref:achaete-scute complex protein T8-like n=1 Tax=Saccostrea cuccullata TaxID=36930 RepID=UPI002ED35CA8